MEYGRENHGFWQKQHFKSNFCFRLISPWEDTLTLHDTNTCLDTYYSPIFLPPSVIMARNSSGQSKAYSVAKKSLRQKRDRRKMSLEKKTHEYSKLCDADVCLGIRIRESGKVFIFSADTSGFWSFLAPHLVGVEKL